MESSDHSHRAVQPKRRYIPIAQDLLREIQAEDGRTEKKLPSDRDLAERYNASRATVREAIFALDMIGVIDVRHGDGTYISARVERLQSSEQFQYGARPEHVIDTRVVIEPSIAGGLAGSHAALDEARKVHENAGAILDVAESVPEFTQLALQFHLELAAALDNQLLGELAYEVISIDNQPLWALINQLALQDVDHRHRLYEEHQQVLDTVAAGDVDLAHATMKTHLSRNKSRILPHS